MNYKNSVILVIILIFIIFASVVPALTWIYYNFEKGQYEDFQNIFSSELVQVLLKKSIIQSVLTAIVSIIFGIIFIYFWELGGYWPSPKFVLSLFFIIILFPDVLRGHSFYLLSINISGIFVYIESFLKSLGFQSIGLLLARLHFLIPFSAICCFMIWSNRSNLSRDYLRAHDIPLKIQFFRIWFPQLKGIIFTCIILILLFSFHGSTSFRILSKKGDVSIMDTIVKFSNSISLSFEANFMALIIIFIGITIACIFGISLMKSIENKHIHEFLRRETIHNNSDTKLIFSRILISILFMLLILPIIFGIFNTLNWIDKNVFENYSLTLLLFRTINFFLVVLFSLIISCVLAFSLSYVLKNLNKNLRLFLTSIAFIPLAVHPLISSLGANILYSSFLTVFPHLVLALFISCFAFPFAFTISAYSVWNLPSNLFNKLKLEYISTTTIIKILLKSHKKNIIIISLAVILIALNDTYYSVYLLTGLDDYIVKNIHDALFYNMNTFYLFNGYILYFVFISILFSYITKGEWND